MPEMPAMLRLTLRCSYCADDIWMPLRRAAVVGAGEQPFYFHCPQCLTDTGLKVENIATAQEIVAPGVALVVDVDGA